VVCNSSKTKRKGEGVGRVVPQTDFWRKYIKKYAKTSFFEAMSEVHKNFEDIFA
jgi:hypothetical protein